LAAATLGAELEGPLPEEPEPEPELPVSPPPLDGVLEAGGVALSVFAGVFDSEPSDPLDLFEEWSAYQPPPLRTKLVRLSRRESVWWAPQCGQVSGAGSFTFWSASEVWWHWLHSYS
jgi:hypothetical protein